MDMNNNERQAAHRWDNKKRKGMLPKKKQILWMIKNVNEWPMLNVMFRHEQIAWLKEGAAVCIYISFCNSAGSELEITYLECKLT